MRAALHLPIVELTTGELTTEYSEGTMKVEGYDGTLRIKIRHRGASSLKYEKKSFAIKLIDDDGNSIDRSFFGMREDNNWILDAMAIDMARMRNRINTDLWNDFSHTTYIRNDYEDESRNGTDGQFVEVFLNNKYHGLYCMTEKFDRKLLKLKKFKNTKVRGVLYKSFSWAPFYGTGTSFYDYDNTSVNWQNFEASYPDIEDGEPFTWKPLADMVKFISTSSNAIFRSEIETKVDVPVCIDYALMMDFIAAQDNVAKNMFAYFYDITETEKMGIGVWDMDHSWGRNYKSELVNHDFDIRVTDNRLFYRLYYVYDSSHKLFRERYAEMRRGVFKAANLRKRFARYFDLFEQTGADERETRRWQGVDGFTLNFKAEREYINQWITDRIRVMDRKYGFTTPEDDEDDPVVTPPQGENDPFLTPPQGESDNPLVPPQGEGEATPVPCGPFHLYTITGTPLGTYATEEEYLQNLDSGIYILSYYLPNKGRQRRHIVR